MNLLICGVRFFDCRSNCLYDAFASYRYANDEAELDPPRRCILERDHLWPLFLGQGVF